MADFIFAMVLSGILFLIIIGVAISVTMGRKRTKKFEEAANEMGLVFLPDGSLELAERLIQFPFFTFGCKRKMKNLIQGDSEEVNIAIFDYEYWTDSDGDASVYRMSIAALESVHLKGCPHFTMRPASVWDRLGRVFGLQDIDFDSHPEFSKRFVLKGPDEEAIRKFFRPALLEFFEKKQGVSVEADPGMMFFYRPNKRVKPEELKAMLAEAYEVFGIMVDEA